MNEGKEAFGSARKGNIGEGVKVRSQKHYKRLCKLDRRLMKIAEEEEWFIDGNVRIYCEWCGREIKNGDGTEKSCLTCRDDVAEFKETLRTR
jgi:hypothetical protein